MYIQNINFIFFPCFFFQEVLPTQLAKFEETQVDFDNFVQSLQRDSEESD